MLSSCEVIAFVPTLQPDRARAFYAEVLGLRFVADEEYALVFDANGTVLRIAKVEELRPARYTLLGWKVPDINRSVIELADRGVTCERYASLAQDELGIWASPGGAKIAWFRDPDGNILSLTQG